MTSTNEVSGCLPHLACINNMEISVISKSQVLLITVVCCLHTLEGSGKFQRREMEVFFSIQVCGSQSELFKRGWSPGVEPGGVMPERAATMGGGRQSLTRALWL